MNKKGKVSENDAILPMTLSQSNNNFATTDHWATTDLTNLVCEATKLVAYCFYVLYINYFSDSDETPNTIILWLNYLDMKLSKSRYIF